MSSRKPPSADPERKRDATRGKLLDRALKLFQKRGVEATTMRDIAKAAGLSLGAAYYYFPSKEALVFAYYEANQAELEEVARRASGTVRERLGIVFHAKLESIRPHRKMLSSIIQRLVDPSDPVGPFSTQTRAVREHAIGLIEQVLHARASRWPCCRSWHARCGSRSSRCCWCSSTMTRPASSAPTGSSTTSSTCSCPCSRCSGRRRARRYA